eukprot:TRINITY_DN776187_c0_g1_i1.p1 TRINITY_DN776187_c0_g1~~TRINITY_DN776187_c0_g1_i1.p1  ORF type:complete len:334 (+),score=101.81 TRINITY_DN776187_c0_g1_i1:34-1035(+)
MELTLMILLAIAGVLVFLVIVSMIKRIFTNKLDVREKHVIVFGGSKGIGLSFCEEIVREGANVTIIARSKKVLEEVTSSLMEKVIFSTQKISFQTCDVTSFESVKEAVRKAEEELGVPKLVVNSAGFAKPAYFMDLTVEDYRRHIDLNYMGCIHIVKAVVKSMIVNGGGDIVLVSSPCGYVSFLGYSAYSPSKFAIRGFADAMRNELQGTSVNMHISYPPDTDTPGFTTENETKPKECLEISPGNPYPSDSVAKCMINGLRRGDYHLPSPDFEQNLTLSSAIGLTPRNNGWMVLETLLQPVIALGKSHFVHFVCDPIARKYGEKLKAELVNAK